MAELRDLRPGLDVTRGLRAGVDIARGAQALKADIASEERAKVTFELNKRATEQALQIQAQQEVDRIETRKIDF